MSTHCTCGLLCRQSTYVLLMSTDIYSCRSALHVLAHVDTRHSFISCRHRQTHVGIHYMQSVVSTVDIRSSNVDIYILLSKCTTCTSSCRHSTFVYFMSTSTHICRHPLHAVYCVDSRHAFSNVDICILLSKCTTCTSSCRHSTFVFCMSTSTHTCRHPLHAIVSVDILYVDIVSAFVYLMSTSIHVYFLLSTSIHAKIVP
jgi:hypothetical protein